MSLPTRPRCGNVRRRAACRVVRCRAPPPCARGFRRIRTIFSYSGRAVPRAAPLRQARQIVAALLK